MAKQQRLCVVFQTLEGNQSVSEHRDAISQIIEENDGVELDHRNGSFRFLLPKALDSWGAQRIVDSLHKVQDRFGHLVFEAQVASISSQEQSSRDSAYKNPARLGPSGA